MGDRRVSIPPTVPIRLAALRTAEELASGSSMGQEGGGSMVRLRIGALVAATAIMFAACGGAASPSPAASGPAATPAPGDSQEPAESPAGEIKEGGTLVVALPGDIDNTDPALISDSNSSYVMNQVMEGLVGLAPGSVSEMVPVLASEMPEVSDDGL